MLAITYAGLLPSAQLTPSAFSHTSGNIPVTTTIHFSGLNTQPAFLIHPASDSPLRVGPRTSLLIWWLTFNQVGLESLVILTHWVTISNFIPTGGNPNDLSLSRHDNREVTKEAFGGRKTKAYRYIPINRSLNPEVQAVLPHDQMDTVLDNATRFALAHCPCRVEAGLMGRLSDRSWTR
jgi:hypothetical protein